MTIEDSALLEGIDLRHVTAYLGSSDWKRREDFPRKDLVVFDGPLADDGEPISAVLPALDKGSDFRRRLAELLGTLAILEERPAHEIALDMRSPGVDRVLARVISDMSVGGSIPLPFASILLQGLRDLVASAACAEEDPRPFFTKATKIGGEHAHAWRFGQTQLGSFVATIECPVVPPAGEDSLPGVVPFPRRVTERIIRGLGQLDRAVLDGRAEALLQGYRTGLNANMCEALLSFAGAGVELQMEFAVQWSKRVPAPDLPRRVLIERRGFELLDAAAKRLRTPAESSERTFTGEIIKLQRESDESRTAVLRFSDSGRRIQAKMHLDVDDYRLACEAHTLGMQVTLRGRLERVGHKQWRIFGIRDFRIDAGSEVERP